MCGRFALDSSSKYVHELFARLDDAELKTGEISPTDRTPVLVEGLEPRVMAWGFPKWDDKGVIFNARQETVLEKTLFRTALLNHPCVIPTTGYFEWERAKGRKEKFLFSEPGHEMVFLAGFFNLFDGKARFNILTTEANVAMLPYHNRMPVLLHEEELNDWTRGKHMGEIMMRIPFALEAKSG